MFIKLPGIKLKKSPKKALKSLATFLLVTSWLLTGYPGFWLPAKNNESLRFPAQVKTVYAAQQEYLSGSGNFSPTWTGSYIFTLVGGGGGGGAGGSSNKNGGGGGGGGGLVQKTVALTSGQNYAYSVGTAGTGGTGNGGSGGNTTFTVGATVYTASGGGGGLSYASGRTGGSGGTGTNGDLNYTGGSGAAGAATYSGGGGSGAGTTGNGNSGTTSTGGAAKTNYGGAGGNGSTANAGAGGAGSAYGGAGGGSTKGTNGASGYAGYIIITWTVPTTTLSTSTDPAAATVAPGSGARSAGQFTFTTDTGSDTITALTLTLAGSPVGAYGAFSSVEIRATSCTGTLYFSSVAPSSDSVSFSGGTALPVSTGGNTYLICVTPKDHTYTAGTYSISPYVSTTWTSSSGNTVAGTDTNANALTIDNTAPNGATSVSGSAGNQFVTLNWTTSSSTDFDATNGSVVLRWAAASAGSEVPAEGNSSYTAGNTITTATVACVISSAASTALSKIDGTGGSTGCTTTALTNGQAYTYKVFQRDQYGNYDAGVSIGTFTPSAASSSFTQNKYRWYYDNDLANPTAAWGAIAIAENTAIPIIPAGYDPPDTTQELRLRVNMVVNTAALSASSKYFKLEYKAGTDGSCTTGSWTDVGTGNWTYATSTVTDGVNITASLSDTTSGKGEQYVKGKPSALNNIGANVGEIIEYDFHVIGGSATPNTTYSFRVVGTDAAGTGETVLDAYTNCATLTTEPGTADLMRHGQVFNNGSKAGFFWAN